MVPKLCLLVFLVFVLFVFGCAWFFVLGSIPQFGGQARPGWFPIFGFSFFLVFAWFVLVFFVFVGFGGQARPESLTSEWISLQRVWRVTIRRCPGDLV